MEESSRLINVELDRKDYGVSFADFLTECDVDGHVINDTYESMIEGKYTQKCEVCKMERSVETFMSTKILGTDMISKWYHKPTIYGEWKEPKDICWHCDEGCMINKPINNPICPTCATPNISDDDSINGNYHVGKNEIILYDCGVCNNLDQIIE
mgnify:CR=1 FL=1